MPPFTNAASLSDTLSHIAVYNRQDETSKSSVIGIAASATLLVVAFVCGLFFWYLRQKKNRQNRDRDGHADLADNGFDSLRDRSSKRKLVRPRNHSQASTDHGTPVPRYQEANEASITTLSIPGRTMSASTVRSLPPSYAIAVCGSPEPHLEAGDEHDTAMQCLHRDNSSAGRPGRPGLLTPMDAHPGSDNNHEQRRERSRSRAPSMEDLNDTLSVASQRPLARPRASSRFQEEFAI